MPTALNHQDPVPTVPPALPRRDWLAEYDSPSALLGAVARIQAAGLEHWETFTPFPIRGLAAGGRRRSGALPWLVFGAGLLGCAAGLLLQYWTNSVDYRWLVSGKPSWSWPAHVPIVFALTVLFAALTALVTLLAVTGIPRFSHPLDASPRFSRATDDRFFLLVMATDPSFEGETTRRLLDSTSPRGIEAVAPEGSGRTAPPRGLGYSLIVAALAACLPWALVAEARATKSRQPRLHLIRDMDSQPRVQAQQAFPHFPDGRGSRPQLPGTVAVERSLDEHLMTGRHAGEPASTFPPSFVIDRKAMTTGRQGFDTYCAPCHGLVGDGDGMIAQRAGELAQGTWVPPSDLNQDYLRQQPIGQLFVSVTDGVRTMPRYDHLLEPEDRWRILLYLRALQRRSRATLTDVPPGQRKALE